MNNTTLVVGYGPGIGAHLFRDLDECDSRIGVSRSHSDDRLCTQYICCGVGDFGKHVGSIGGKVSLVVYVPSEFGESKKLTMEEYDSFMDTGPRGMLSVFHSLIDAGCLSENALFVSVGSTASESSHKPSNNNPVYAVAKSTQKSLVAQLAGAHKSYRFATITLGAIQDGNKGVGYDNITRTIKFLKEMNTGVRYTEIELNSELDI
ncbi:hypothetical protein [Persicirhabdus sediminis]|uniref:Uncharacterized protein n=1 Tax=Persicirhabdus sediminis TaxID=454144 RepID=A0A8J7SI79_9BACT|nr:hypothetical protein [Persicirhabdus sediminis]MBK1790256.1 hypothetical protein [Persicirhabdus sediminis]